MKTLHYLPCGVMQRGHVVVPGAIHVGLHLGHELADHLYVAVASRVVQRRQRLLVEVVDASEEVQVKVGLFVESAQNGDVAIAGDLEKNHVIESNHES